MRLFIGFDDTDILGSEFGTGKLVRGLGKKLPQGATVWGVVRHQLLIDERIPATSHNSSACAIVDLENERLYDDVTAIAVRHIEETSLPGSDPGLCVAAEGRIHQRVIEFAIACTHAIETQGRTRLAASASSLHLSGHGGNEDGIIGALAAVGLTAHGQSGRFIDRGRLRDLPDPCSHADLLALEVQPVDVGRDSLLVPPDAVIYTNGWPRPRLSHGRAILPVRCDETGRWTTLCQKRIKGNHAPSN